MTQYNQTGGRRRRPDWKQPATRIAAALVTGLLVLGAVFIVANRDRFSLDALKRYFIYRNLEKNDDGQTTEFNYSQDATNAFASLDGTLLVCSDTALQLYSNSGLQYINEQVKMEQPVISTCGTYAVAYDVGGNDLYLIHNKKIVQKYSSESGCGLLSARANENGFLAVVEQTSGYKASVKVFDDQANLMLAENVSSEYVMDAIVTPTNRQLVVLTIGQHNRTFDSTITLYDCQEGDRLYQTTLEDQFVLDLNWRDGQLWIQERDGAAVLDDELNVIGSWSEPSQYLQGYSLEGDNHAVEVFSWYKAGGSGEVLLIGSDGEASVSKAISGQVLSVSAAGRYIAVLTTDALTIYTGNLTEYSSTENKGAQRAIINRDGATMLIGADSTRLYVP